jgi:nucleoside triphosphate pyrophosphatase
MTSMTLVASSELARLYEGLQMSHKIVFRTQKRKVKPSIPHSGLYAILGRSLSLQEPKIVTSVINQPWTLASASPRRLAILRQVGVEPTVIVANVEEKQNGASAELLGLRNARNKLEAVLPQISSGLVLAADTLVILDNIIMGKPRSEEDALHSLRKLQNRTHRVITAWVLHHVDSGSQIEGVESTDVRMRSVSDQDLMAYIQTGEPMDKAGAYGIQGAAAAFVEGINGCYFNVVGLPISSILTEAAVLTDTSTPVKPGGEGTIHG